MRILVTGTAGFIGFHLARRLLDEGHAVTGVDGMTPYYDVRLKVARNALLEGRPGFASHVLMLEDAVALAGLAAKARPEVIVHLAGQAGVRYSLENPRAYVDANLVGVFNVLEAARTSAVKHLLMASTSSVYGANARQPFVETDAADHPLTFYAATKKAGEAMSHAYSHLWDLPTTLFRFFTVYGPWGRPDMAPMKFMRAIAEGEAIEVYNHGDMERDFTFIDDLVEAVVRLTATPPRRGDPAPGGLDSLSPVAPWRVVNIGRGSPVRLTDFIAELERAIGQPALRRDLPMQAGDVPSTFADARLLEALTGYRPATDTPAGVAALWAWYRQYHGLTGNGPAGAG